MYLSNDRHEAHEAPCWAPQEILHPVAQRPFGLAVDDAGTDLHGVDVSQQGFQQHLGTIQLRAPPLLFFRYRTRGEPDGSGLHA